MTGPEVGATLARPLRGNLYMFGMGRYTVMFGTEKYDNTDAAWNTRNCN